MYTYSADGLKVELAMCSPEMAQALIDGAPFEGQREPSEVHIDYLIKEAQRGHFMRGTQVHLCRLGDAMHLVNGQHTLRMIATGGIAIPLVFLYEDVTSIDEVGRIYGRHDIHRIRNWSAVLRATGQYEKFTIGGGWLNAALAAMQFVMTGLKTGPNSATQKQLIYARSRDDRITALEEYKDEIEMYVRACHKTPMENQLLLRRRAIMACGIYVCRYQGVRLADFIQTTARDDGLASRSPQKKLLQWLSKNRAHTGILPHFRAFEACWNAFYKKQDMDRLVFSSSVLRFNGTPLGKVLPIDPLKIETVKDAPTGFKTGVKIGRNGGAQAVVMGK